MTTSEARSGGRVRPDGRDHFTDFDLDAPEFAADYEPGWPTGPRGR